MPHRSKRDFRDSGAFQKILQKTTGQKPAKTRSVFAGFTNMVIQLLCATPRWRSWRPPFSYEVFTAYSNVFMESSSLKESSSIQRTVTRALPPTVQVNNVKSQVPLSISFKAMDGS